MEPAADSPPTDSDKVGNVSRFGAPQDSTVSDQWNRNEVNQTRLERDFLLSLFRNPCFNNPSFYQDLSRQWTGSFFLVLQSVAKAVG